MPHKEGDGKLLGLPGPDLIDFVPAFSLNDAHLVGCLQREPELL